MLNLTRHLIFSLIVVGFGCVKEVAEIPTDDRLDVDCTFTNDSIQFIDRVLLDYPVERKDELVFTLNFDVGISEQEGYTITTFRSGDPYLSDQTQVRFKSGNKSKWFEHYSQNTMLNPITQYSSENCDRKQLLLAGLWDCALYEIGKDTLLYVGSLKYPDGFSSFDFMHPVKSMDIQHRANDFLFSYETEDTIIKYSVELFQDSTKYDDFVSDYLPEIIHEPGILNSAVEALNQPITKYPIYRLNTYTNDSQVDTAIGLIDWDSRTFNLQYASYDFQLHSDSIYFMNDTLHFEWSYGWREHTNCVFIEDYHGQFVFDTLYNEAMCTRLDVNVVNGQSCECDGVIYSYDLSDQPLSLRRFIETYNADTYITHNRGRIFEPKEMYNICSDSNEFCSMWLPKYSDLQSTLKYFPVSEENKAVYVSIADYFLNNRFESLKSNYVLREKIIKEHVREFELK